MPKINLQDKVYPKNRGKIENNVKRQNHKTHSPYDSMSFVSIRYECIPEEFCWDKQCYLYVVWSLRDFPLMMERTKRS